MPDAGDPTLAPRFFAKASEIIDTPWQIAAGNDLRHPRLSHQQSAIGRFMNWYIGKVHHAGAMTPLSPAHSYALPTSWSRQPGSLLAGRCSRSCAVTYTPYQRTLRLLPVGHQPVSLRPSTDPAAACTTTAPVGRSFAGAKSEYI